MSDPIIDNHPAVKAVDDHLARLEAELKVKEAEARKEQERYRVALATATQNDMVLPDPPELDMQRVQSDHLRRREQLKLQRARAIQDNREELVAQIKARHDVRMADLKPAVELLLAAGPGLLEDVRAVIEATRGTQLATEVPRWCEHEHNLRIIQLDDILRAVEHECGFVGDPVLAPMDHFGRRSA